MATVEITYTRHDHLAQFDSIVESVALPEVVGLCELGVGFAQERSPIDRGFYRNGFTNEVKVTGPGVITGRIFNTADPIVVEVIENGRKPGRFPPVDVIRAWAMRKLAVPVNLAASVAYLIGRKIARFGIPGKFVFRETAVALKPEIDAAGVRIVEGIAARL